MLKIRLQRTGRKNNPSYRVVVTEHTRGPKSENHVDRVGFYNPKTKETNLQSEKIQYWISVGAKASDTVHNMLLKAGIIKGKTINVLPQKTPVVKEVSEEEKKEAEKPVAEASAEEASAETVEEVKEEAKEEITEVAAETTETEVEEKKEDKAPVESVSEEGTKVKEEAAPTVVEEKKEENA